MMKTAWTAGRAEYSSLSSQEFLLMLKIAMNSRPSLMTMANPKTNRIPSKYYFDFTAAEKKVLSRKYYFSG